MSNPETDLTADHPPLSPGTLYLIATPIGNLEDITLRALRTLRECDLIAAEDTRRTGLLLHRYKMRKPLISCFHFNETARSAQIIERLGAGQTVALVSDAGSPGISDPGQRLVRRVLEAGLRVEPVPGPCALVAALTASGLPTDEFHFIGFLPQKAGARLRRLAALCELPGTLALYESPHRIARLLTELGDLVPNRTVVLAKELTKKFEQFFRGRPAELQAMVGRGKGEWVVLIAPSSSSQASPPDSLKQTCQDSGSPADQSSA